MTFSKRFSSNPNNFRKVEFKELSEEKTIQSNSNQMGNIPLAIFHLTEQGPSVLYKDFEELDGIDVDKKEITHNINNLAANLIAATGSGHTYSEGCFDIKLGSFNEYRLFIIAIKRPNINYIDTRIKSGYFQIVLFIPKELALTLPSMAFMEDELYSTVSTDINNSEDFYPDRIHKLKKKLIKKINSFSY